jgi:hypothetical protein
VILCAQGKRVIQTTALKSVGYLEKQFSITTKVPVVTAEAQDTQN